MKNKIRSLALFAAAALLSGCITACSGDASPSAEVTSSAAQTQPPAESETERYVKDTLPSDLDFKGEKTNIIVRQSVAEKEFYVENLNGEIVNDAIYERNRSVEDRLNVKLSFITAPGDWAQQMEYTNLITSSVMAGDNAYDIVSGLSNITCLLVLNGAVRNLLGLPYLSPDKPWWSEKLISECTVDGKLFLASGDASLEFIRGMMCMFFNKELILDHNMEDPYELVFAGKWTVDKLEKLAKDIYSDLNGNAVTDAEDRYGFIIMTANTANGFIDAFDLKVTANNSAGMPELVFKGGKVSGAIERLCSLLYTNNGMACGANDAAYDSLMPIFLAGRALFIAGQFGYTDVFRDLTFDWGVLPLPKLNEEQDEYLSNTRNTYSNFSVPVICRSPELSGAVLEAFASESYRSLTGAYFETALKVKYSRDDISAKIFDLIRSSMNFNFGITYGVAIGEPTGLFKAAIAQNNTNWESTWAAKEESFNTQLAKLMEAIKAVK